MFTQAMQTHGYTQGTRCGVRSASSTPPEEQLSAGDRCLLTTLNGEPVFAAGVQTWRRRSATARSSTTRRCR